MMNPRYRDVIKDTIPEVSPQKNVKIKIISGDIGGIQGPVKDLVVDTEYIDVAMAPNTEFEHPTKKGYKSFAYIIEGKGYFDTEKKKLLDNGHIVIYEDRDKVKTISNDDHLRFLFISGKPLGEPVAWYGPVVMNTHAELRTAFEEYQNGTFLKHNT